MSTMIQRKNAQQLLALLALSGRNIDWLRTISAAKFKSGGFHDLNLDVLDVRPNEIRLSLAHNVPHESGDLIADPDMEMIFMTDEPALMARTYQNDYAAFFDTVEGLEPGLATWRQKNLDEFLEMWLENLLSQGHLLESARPA